MRKCKKHKWIPLLGKLGEENIPTSLFVCLNCGQLKIGTKTIRISKYRIDMGGGQIKNASAIYASELHGTVYYGHLYFKEKRCPLCYKAFKLREKIALIVVEKGKRGIGLIPSHMECLKKYGI